MSGRPTGRRKRRARLLNGGRVRFSIEGGVAGQSGRGGTGMTG